jgi:hypothetical protein
MYRATWHSRMHACTHVFTQRLPFRCRPVTCTEAHAQTGAHPRRPTDACYRIRRCNSSRSRRQSRSCFSRSGQQAPRQHREWRACTAFASQDSCGACPKGMRCPGGVFEASSCIGIPSNDFIHSGAKQNESNFSGEVFVRGAVCFKDYFG